ncbi:MAG: hypothetical protein Q9227_006062 [Pyrenula ochraceoflavens]
MRVLCLGYSRTGTISLLAALKELGYHPYHMAEAIKDASMDFPLWEEALRAKFMGDGPLWGKDEFDKMLGRFDGCEDVPCILFAEELINMYPEAKVILTHRPAEDWARSIGRVLGGLMSWPWGRYAWADPYLTYPWFHYLGVIVQCLNWGNDPKVMIDAYNSHYDLVRRVCPKERLLELELGKTSWEQVCGFLGEEVPKGKAWPRTNDGNQFLDWHWEFYKRARGMAVQKCATVGVAAVGVVGLSWYWWTR